MILAPTEHCYCFPSGSVVKNPPANGGDTGDSGSIPGLGRSPGEGHDNPILSNIKRSEELDLKFSSTTNLPL